MGIRSSDTGIAIRIAQKVNALNGHALHNPHTGNKEFTFEFYDTNIMISITASLYSQKTREELEQIIEEEVRIRQKPTETYLTDLLYDTDYGYSNIGFQKNMYLARKNAIK